MWSIGVVTTLLLTGERPFSWTHPEGLPPSYEQFEQRADWQRLRGHPKDFINKLLVLNEATRLTAEQALHHEWLTNESHYNAYRTVYEKAISGWKKGTTQVKLIETISGHCSEGVCGNI